MTTTVYYETETKNGKEFRDLTKNRKTLFLSTRRYYLERSREDGEKDLERIVDNADDEGCWLFDADNSRWYNLVKGHLKTGVEYEELPWGCENIFLGKAGKNVLELGNCTHYHTHQANAREYSKQLLLNRQLNKNLSEKDKRIIDCNTNIAISIPSEKDILTYACILTISPNLNIDFRIASPHGMIKVKFKNEATNVNEAALAYEKMFKDGLELSYSKRKFYSEEYERHAISRGIYFLRERLKDHMDINFTFREE